MLNRLWCLVAAVLLSIAQLALYYYIRRKHSSAPRYPFTERIKLALDFIYPGSSRWFLRYSATDTTLSRKQHELIIKRSKNIQAPIVRSTLTNPRSIEYECVRFAKEPIVIQKRSFEVKIGTAQCTQPYNLSLLNAGAIEASLNKDALLALSEGAKIQGFAVNTGESGISSYLIRGGGDLIWQINNKRAFKIDDYKSEVLFKRDATRLYIKMVEIVPSDNDLLSITKELTANKVILYLNKLRHLSGGKPIGIKLHQPDELLISCIGKSMSETGVHLDFVTVESSGFEFDNKALNNTLFFNALAQTRKMVDKYHLPTKIIASGLIVTEYDILKLIALGAHACCCTSPMILAMGTHFWFQKNNLLIQRVGVANFHRNTLEATVKLMELCRYYTLEDVKASNFYRRSDFLKTRNLKDIYIETTYPRLTLLSN